MRRAGRPWRPSPRLLPRLLPWPAPALADRRCACCRPGGRRRSVAATGGRLPGRAGRGRPDGGPDGGAEGAAGRRLRAGNQVPGAAGAVRAGPCRPGDGPGGRGRLCPDRQRTHRRGPPRRSPGPDDGAAADPGRPCGPGRSPGQHARILVDETSSLDAAGAAALEAHFLDPGAPNPARGCPAGELVPSRFRAKARTWRERHHPASIEERHTTSVADRRVEFVPDRDGMAWLSAHLPADTAAGIWERTTAAARALQGPDESRTLAQLRADITATWLLTTGTGTGADGRRRHGGTADGGAGGGPAPVRARVRAGVFRSRGRRSWSPSRSCPCSAPPTNRPSWTGTGRSRRRWPAAWSPTAPVPSTGS